MVLDDCNFHESVRLDDFESERALTLVSPLVHLVQYCLSLSWKIFTSSYSIFV